MWITNFRPLNITREFDIKFIRSYSYDSLKMSKMSRFIFQVQSLTSAFFFSFPLSLNLITFIIHSNNKVSTGLKFTKKKKQKKTEH